MATSNAKNAKTKKKKRVKMEDAHPLGVTGSPHDRALSIEFTVTADGEETSLSLGMSVWEAAALFVELGQYFQRRQAENVMEYFGVKYYGYE